MGRKKKEIKMKEPVRIREKRLNDGNVSLYLDMYYMGARKKEGAEALPRSGSERCRQITEPEYAQACRANQGGAYSRHSATWTCKLGEREKGADDACHMGGEVHER